MTVDFHRATKLEFFFPQEEEVCEKEQIQKEAGSPRCPQLRGVLPYQEVGGGGGAGGLDLTSSSEAKFGARSSQGHQIRGKLGKFCLPQDTKVGEESQFWGHI